MASSLVDLSIDDDKPVDFTVPWRTELYKLLPKDGTVEFCGETPHRPSAIFTPTGGDIRFDVVGNGKEFIYPRKTRLTFKARIRTRAGANITAAHIVGPVQVPGHAAFGSCTVIVGNQVISSDPHYPHTSQHAIQQSFGRDAKKSWLSSCLYAKDTAGHMDAHTNAAEGAQNLGLNKRAAYFQNSYEVEFCIRLNSTFFNVNKLVPNLLNMTVILGRSKPEFFLMALGVPAVIAQPNANPAIVGVDAVPPAYNVEIIDPVLWVTKVRLSDFTFEKLADPRVLGKKMCYDIEREVTRSFLIPRGTRSHTIDNVCGMGQIPKRLMFGFVHSQAFNGDYGRNPFNYEHINLSHAAVFVNGQCFPQTPFTPVYAGNNPSYMREFESVPDSLGYTGGNVGTDIDRDEYPNGYCLYGFDLTPTGTAHVSSSTTKREEGNVRIEFRLSEQVEDSYMCVVFLEFENKMYIDKDNNVIVNYTQ